MAHTLACQVGGHKGVMTSEDDSLIIKPALATEIAFYQALNSDPVLSPLRPFVPQFLGTLQFQGQLIEPDGDLDSNNIHPGDKSDKLWGSLVLENLTRSFSKPNVLDVKLGTVLYDEDAPVGKRERMMETARNTTSFETGVRLTGFQVYDNVTNEPVLTPKSYGKSIKPSQLPDGIARFLPVSSKEMPSVGLPVSLLLPILQGIKQTIQEMRDVVASLEVRIVGGSLLVIYEADWERAEQGLKWLEEEESEEEDDDDDDSEEDSKDGPPFVVKLIDFGHSRLTPGRGPDSSVLTGMDTMLRLIEGRIKELKNYVPAIPTTPV